MEVSLYHPQRLLERAAPVQMPQLSLPSDPFYSTPSMGNWQLGIHRPCNADHCHITHFPAPHAWEYTFTCQYVTSHPRI